MNLGVDLGSTYSSFSTYDIVNKNVELCKPVMSEPEAIPSIACLNDDGKMLTGYTARKYIQLDDPSARTFSAFKMLLTESNEKLLQERGFGTDYTPSAVAETFLRDQVNKILSSHADPGVDNLVICAPEVWTTQSAVRRGQLDGRTILRDICSRIPGVDRDRIRIVSEPAAASAYFAYQYRRAVGSNFNGCLLIVDYGGGTLDLTLTEVHPQDASVEIKVLFRTGAGENVQGRTGNAGIAYMEHAVHLALEEGGCDPAELLPCRPEFRKAVDVLEDRLMEQISPNTPDQAGSMGEDYRKLWDTVDECGADLSDLLNNDETFAAIRYGGKRYPVTYAHLMRAYRAGAGQVPSGDGRLDEGPQIRLQKSQHRRLSYRSGGRVRQVSAGAEAGGVVFPPSQYGRPPVSARPGPGPGIRRVQGSSSVGFRRDDHPAHRALRYRYLFRGR